MDERDKAYFRKMRKETIEAYRPYRDALDPPPPEDAPCWAVIRALQRYGIQAQWIHKERVSLSVEEVEALLWRVEKNE
jgi:hypothetical protein